MRTTHQFVLSQAVTLPPCPCILSPPRVGSFCSPQAKLFRCSETLANKKESPPAVPSQRKSRPEKRLFLILHLPSPAPAILSTDTSHCLRSVSGSGLVSGNGLPKRLTEVHKEGPMLSAHVTQTEYPYAGFVWCVEIALGGTVTHFVEASVPANPSFSTSTVLSAVSPPHISPAD